MRGSKATGILAPKHLETKSGKSSSCPPFLRANKNRIMFCNVYGPAARRAKAAANALVIATPRCKGPVICLPGDARSKRHSRASYLTIQAIQYQPVSEIGKQDKNDVRSGRTASTTGNRGPAIRFLLAREL
jgi:hypothetical protein